MPLRTDYDYYKRGIVSRFDVDSSSYGTLRAYGSLGVKVQADMEREAILRVINSLRSKRALDVGCGLGRYMVFTAKRLDVVGLDISVNMVRAAKQTLKNLDIVLADMEYIPFRDSSFELVYSIRAMKYLSNQAKFLREARRVCSHEGCVLLYDIWNAKNVSYLFSETCLRFMSILRPHDFPPEMRRMNHLLIKRTLEQWDGCEVQTRGILFLPLLIYARTSSRSLLRIFTIFDKLLSRLPFSQYLAFSVLYVAIRR
ncbi:MAG: class I SAM-dependent methyltransferase [Candidatus Bathyarchaeia archaeon]|jgi:ubiquinone/menaquinone biosynthesis C-methylase UbiE